MMSKVACNINFYFSIMWICVFVWDGTCVSAEAHRGQKNMLEALLLKFQAAVRHLMWTLVTVPGKATK